jgi:predicted HD superfamily hydrolase involved in NAD metabolism
MYYYDDLYLEVKNVLSEKRFKHTLGVVERAIEYANIYGENIENVKIAAILHDCAKEISEEESLSMLNEYGVKLDEIEKKNTKLLHAKLGAEIAKHKYGLSDEIANAIRYHTTGRENMTMLEKIIYLADATEKNRTYYKEENELSLEEVVRLIEKDIDEGMQYVLKWTINSLIRRNLYIHINSVKAYNYYLKK